MLANYLKVWEYYMSIAIWLSIKSIYLSTIASDKTARAAEDTSSSRLENLFDKMYNKSSGL